jgi:hypothetical protein
MRHGRGGWDWCFRRAALALLSAVLAHLRRVTWVLADARGQSRLGLRLLPYIGAVAVVALLAVALYARPPDLPPENCTT